MDSCEYGVDDFLTIFMDTENSIPGIPLNLENDETMMESLCPPSSDMPNDSLVKTDKFTDDKDNSFVLDCLNSEKDQSIVTASESSDAERESNGKKRKQDAKNNGKQPSTERVRKKRKSFPPQKQRFSSPDNFVCNEQPNEILYSENNMELHQRGSFTPSVTMPCDFSFNQAYQDTKFNLAASMKRSAFSRMRIIQHRLSLFDLY